MNCRPHSNCKNQLESAIPNRQFDEVSLHLGAAFRGIDKSHLRRGSSSMTKPSGPLAGIKVLDLTSVLYGPYASQTLGDWGAEVIKIEPLTGDGWRNSGQFRNRGMSGQFMAVNRNKRSLALDLKQPGGKKVMERLLTKVDALVTNVRPAALGRLGFGYEACQKLNPGLVYAAATGFGQEGPWAARPAFDEIAQAASGLASAMGSDDEPSFVPSLVGDKICGLS